MDRKISFHGMDHSDPIEKHANEKINKIEELLTGSEWQTPINIELRLKANRQHSHHHVEINLKTPQFNLNTHSEDPDMYFAIDNAIDKMATVLDKEKKKIRDKKQKVETEKKNFSEDKYDL